MNWGLIGCGFVADRHIKAIKHIGHNLVAVADPNPKNIAIVPAFVSRYLGWETMLKHEAITHIAICAPSHRHAEIALACQDKQVLCEKPLALNVGDMKGLNGNVGTVMQLRYLPEIQELKEKITEGHVAKLEVLVSRGRKNRRSWKADVSKSGGDLFNIGIHYFDLLTWLFGNVKKARSICSGAGSVDFEKGSATWSIRTDQDVDKQKRELTVDGKVINLVQPYQPLYNKLYEDFVNDKKIGVFDAARSISITRKLGGGIIVCA
jgi:UDP-N-acetyl-2-amino-2-deoxyglucuronate dehydrogenase